ncbi:MAG: helix-turn-helix domain-containing protein, partial [Waltera sp.]
FHLTLTQYLMHLRLTHACHLLESTSLPVTEVALQSGFSNVSHFIRSFHASFRMSPLQYRKKRDQSFT